MCGRKLEHQDVFPLIFEKLTRHISELYYDNFMDRFDLPSLCFRVKPATSPVLPFKQRLIREWISAIGL